MKGTDHYVSRPDGKVYYHKIGRGEPLLLIHNIGMSGWIWRKVLDKFAQHFTCYVVDLPGFDHSDMPQRRYSISDFTPAILDVMDAAGIRQASFVVYHTGALVAVHLAVLHPERVKRLVLDGLPYWNKERGQILWDRFFEPQFTDTTAYPVPVHPFVPWEEARKANPRLEREYWEKSEEIKRKSRLWVRYGYEALSQFDTEALGPKVKVPTLLVYGEHDALRRGEQRAHAAIKGSVLHVVPGANAVHNDSPEEFAKLALDFLLARS